MELLGREREKAALDEVVDAARRGIGTALVLRGEAGIGKTALLEHAVEAATGMDVLRVVGIESEMELGFAALHQLLLPFLDRLDAMPAPQAAALRSAFGLELGGPPDRLLVGLASLTLLADASTERGVLCVVDDAQWLDRSSAQALGFVARRLEVDRVAMVFAVRDPSEHEVVLDGLPELHVSGLPERESRALLASAAAAGRVDAGLSERIVAEAGGNPLALVELGSEVTPDALAGALLLDRPLPVSHRLEARFLRQVETLPVETQRLLLAAAADPTGDPALLWRAGEDLGFGHDAAAPAEAADLLALGPPVAFRHPLIRSAVYQGATAADRRRTHAALADATDGARDADRRAWHRATAASSRDEAVAVELEQAAERTRKRGGYAASAAFLTRAAELTPDPHRRVDRLLAAADAHTLGGAPNRAHTLLAGLDPSSCDAFQRAWAQQLDGVARMALRQSVGTPGVLLHAAMALEPFDLPLAQQTLLEALTVSTYQGVGAPPPGLVEISRAALAMPHREPGAATIRAELLHALAVFFTEGFDAGAPLVRRAVDTLLDETTSPEDSLRLLGFACWAANAMCDPDTQAALAERLDRLSREFGAVGALSSALQHLGVTALDAGRLAEAEARFAEERVIEHARGAGGMPGRLGEVVAHAWQGREDAAAELQQLRDAAEAQGWGWVGMQVAQASAVLALGANRYDEALVQARRAHELDIHSTGFALPGLAEAAIRSGDRVTAEDVVAQLASRAAGNPTVRSRGQLLRSEALLADDDAAGPLYEEAIAVLRQARGPWHSARTQLVYGEWLRQQRRRREARDHLRAAFEAFESMGAAGYAERARLELVAAGEAATSRPVDADRQLTPQEQQIARLAREGATNSEIAAQLYISAHTVEYHLRKVFRKLGIGSRRQLSAALAD